MVCASILGVRCGKPREPEEILCGALRTLAVAIAVVALLGACGRYGGSAVRTIEDTGGTATASGTGSGTTAGVATSSPSQGLGRLYARIDVAAHALVTQDVCEINTLLEADQIDFTAISTLYSGGQASVNAGGSMRSLGGFRGQPRARRADLERLRLALR